MRPENKTRAGTYLGPQSGALHRSARPWSRYVVATSFGAASIAILAVILLIGHGPLWFVPVTAVFVALGTLKDWKRYGQYAPLGSGYVLITAVLGYGLLTHFGRYNVLTWLAWIAVTGLLLDLAKRRFRIKPM